MNNKFWNWTNNSETKTRTLEMNGEIAAESWWGDEVTPQDFKEELNAAEGDIELLINSPGGDCIAASQIYTMLKEYDGKVTVKIDGLAASAASVIAMAGDEVLMAPTAMLMIHNPATMAFGDHNDMAHAIEVLNEFKESIINAYQLKTNLTREKISELMENETWMNAKKAIELKFADGIIGEDSQQSAGFLFAANQARLQLVNKLNSEQPETAEMGENGAHSDPVIDAEEEETGISTEILKRKLNIAKLKIQE